MKRYTKPVNIRFEPTIDESLEKIRKMDTQCRRQNWSKSDVVRHMVRIGIKNWENNMRRQNINV